MRNTLHRGFTLIELAMVLVIIGLIVGGIVVGRNLIKTSELRSVTSDVEKFKSAINTFQTKYGGLPGDLTNAIGYFGTSSTNGNGNGLIDYVGGGMGEEYNAWQQLSAAGLIPGTYTGATNSLPAGKLPNSFYRVSYQTGVYGKNGHMISFNGFNAAANVANLAIVSPADLYALDLKVDDGKADNGQIMGFNVQGVPGCATNDYTAGSGSYLSMSTDVTCKIFFVIGGY